MGDRQWGHGYWSGFTDGIKCKLSFYEFCCHTHYNDDSDAGDFCDDVRRDDHFPKTASEIAYYDFNTKAVKRHKSYHQAVKDYLFNRRACKQAMDAFEAVWREWKCLQKTGTVA